MLRAPGTARKIRQPKRELVMNRLLCVLAACALAAPALAADVGVSVEHEAFPGTLTTGGGGSRSTRPPGNAGARQRNCLS